MELLSRELTAGKVSTGRERGVSIDNVVSGTSV